MEKDRSITNLIEEVREAYFNQSTYLDIAQSLVIKHHSIKLMNGNRKKSSIYLSKLWSDGKSLLILSFQLEKQEMGYIDLTYFVT
jgi:hypothetical protein